ncbi:unnamed product [Ostreococcus tauri]|uniref:Unnamed product n=1 Tax=Ostreococcus tauri TaxID=70448 RepID=A0A090M249_OSTTA|nr:unnamed product [Ostreococcus tauri]CEF98271.1 unnamed product [Ostreococcus tauri]|eukprot:XP_022839176.1 unnamed product [Ostreococcus tauri]
MGLYDDLPDAVAVADARAGATGTRAEGTTETVTTKRRRTETTATPTTTATLRRLAPHLATREKFARASSMLGAVLASEGCERRDNAAAFECVRNAMTPTPKRALERATRVAYEELFKIVDAVAPVIFNAKQRRKVEVWRTYALGANALHTDDSYAFSKAVRAIQDKVEALDAYVDEERIDVDAEIEVPPAPEDASEEDARAMAEAFVAAVKAERAAEIEARAVEDEQRVAYIDCLEVAASLYHRPWAQTTIDMMANFFHERRDKFSPSSREDVVKIWDDLRKKKIARKAGGGDGGDMTQYERDAARAASTKVSARGAVGSERLNDGRGEACAKMLG